MIHDARRAKEAAEMALSDDLRKRVVEAVTDGGMSRNAAAKRFGVSIASAVRWLHRFAATGEISPAPTGGVRRSDRIEGHHLAQPARRRSRLRRLGPPKERRNSARTILSSPSIRRPNPVQTQQQPLTGQIAASPRGGTKIAQVIELLQHGDGATLAELVAATGWLPHTTRAALTGLRKRGYAVGIDRADKARGSVYRIEPRPMGGDSAVPLVGAAPTCEAPPARPKNAASLRTRRAA